MKKSLFILFFICQVFSGLAAKVNFEAKVSHSRVQLGQRFQITFTVNENGEKFVPPPFYKFNLLSGPNRSSSMQYVNGKVSRSLSFSYILQAKEVGTFKIGGATVIVNGKEYKTNPISIEVIKGNANSPNQRNQRSRANKKKNNLNDYVFVRATVDKKSVYLGEKVSVTYKLFSRLTLTGLNLEKLPSLNGFWTQDIRTIYDEIKLKRERINGVVYQTTELQKSVLYPQRSGELSIDPMEIKVAVQTESNRRRSVFDQIFGSYETKELVVGSRPIKIQVNPLPQKGRPSDFSGAVGDFQMELTVNKDSVAANEAIDFRLTIKGNGNLPLVSSPDLNFPPDFESYDPEVSNNYKTSYSGAVGSKSFNYLVIPRHSGDFTIEPYRFSYFDLSSNAYKTLSSPNLNIKVSKGSEDENLVYRSSRKEEVELLNADIRHIHFEPSIFLAANEMFFGSSLFYGLIIFFISLMFISYWLIKRYLSKQSNIKELRKSKANKMAKKRLRKAKKYLDQKQLNQFYEELSTALYGYFSDKFNLDLAELSQERIVSLLRPHDESGDLEQHLVEIMDAVEMARFTPNLNIEEQQLYERAVELISKTDDLKV